MLTYTFDDGRISVYENALPVLEKYGQVGVVGIITRAAYSTWRDFMHQQELVTLQEKGWEIASHSITHPHFSKIPQTYDEEILSGWSQSQAYDYVYQTYYTYDELPFVLQDNNKLKRKNSLSEVASTSGSFYFDNENHIVYVHTTNSDNPSNYKIRADSVERELEWSKKELENLGLNVQSFLVPYSDWNENRAKIAEKYYKCVGAGGGTANKIPIDNPYFLYRKPVKGDITVNEVISWIDQYVVNGGKWLILMFHGIGEKGGWEPWPKENLEEVAKYVNENNIKVVTLEGGLKILSTPIPGSLYLLVFGIGIFVLGRKAKAKFFCIPYGRNFYIR